MSDAMDLFRAARPTPPPAPPPVASGYSVGTVGGARDLHDLAMVPGSPAYRARIPKPPCFQCGEDHFPNREYNHEWQAEIVGVHDEPVSASPAFRRPTMIDVSPQANPLRVALYVGRGDTYVVSVESAPDWDTVENWRVPDTGVLPLISMARALGVKIADKTGGDLMMLEQESAGQHAQDHGRGAQSVRGDSPRRQGYDPNGYAEGLSPGVTETPAGTG